MASEELKKRFKECVTKDYDWETLSDDFKSDEWGEGYRAGHHSRDDEVEYLEKNVLLLQNNAYNRGFENGLQNKTNAEYVLKGLDKDV